MNKTIKKIVALTMGATMLAGTATMALATSLSDYPAPFVKEGAYVGKIVIGETAAAMDTLGAMDIAASLQRASVTAVSSSGSTSSASAADGYLFKENEVLVYGANLTSVGKLSLDDSDLPELLESGMVEADDGTEYDYDVKLDFADSVGTVDATISSDLKDLKYTKPMAYFNFNDGLAYDVVVDFGGDEWSAEDFVKSETINLFGTEYTFDPANKNDDLVLTLYGSGTSVFVSKGTPQKVIYKEKEYTIEVLGGNTANAEANIRVNGEVLTVEKDKSYTLPKKGLPFFVKQVFVDDSIAAGADISVQLFVGSDKLELDVGGEVTKNGVVLDEVTLVTNNLTGWSDVDTLTFTVTPSDGETETLFILPGEAYVDPVFGAFKLDFVGAKDLTAGKELLAFTKSGDTASIEFTPRGATKSTKLLVLNDDATEADMWNNTDLTDLTKDEIFFWNDGTDDTDMVTHVLQIASIRDGNTTSSDNFKVVINDLTTGKPLEFDDATNALSSDITLYAVNGTAGDKSITLSGSIGGAAADANYTLYTKAGARVDFDNTFINYVITEDADGDADTTTAVSLNANFTWVTDEYNVDVGGLTALADDEDNNNYRISEFGTFVDEETDNSDYVKVYLPAEEVSYDMFLLPVDSKVTISTAATGGAVLLNPIMVDMAILDKDANLGGSTPYIVVGGPCRNTVAAALLGNKENCVEGFSEGTAVIKLFADKNAMLVAGYSAQDTKGATKVLANYKDYATKFTGAELKVSTANLAQLSVSNVQ